MKTKILLLAALALQSAAQAQNLPHHWQLNEMSHELSIGDVEESGLFNVSVIDTIYLEFEDDKDRKSVV